MIAIRDLPHVLAVINASTIVVLLRAYGLIRARDREGHRRTMFVAIGLGVALDYMLKVGREAIADHEAELRDYAHARLREFNWLTIYGRGRDKGAIVSFSIDGLHPHDVSTIIDRSGVAVRAGHHCAQPLMDRLGVTATCRASFAMYNTKGEVDALAEALIKAHDFLG